MKSIKNPRNHYSHVYRELFDGYQRLAKDKKGIQINQNSKLNFLKSVNKKNENRFNFKQNKIAAKNAYFLGVRNNSIDLINEEDLYTGKEDNEGSGKNIEFPIPLYGSPFPTPTNMPFMTVPQESLWTPEPTVTTTTIAPTLPSHLTSLYPNPNIPFVDESTKRKEYKKEAKKRKDKRKQKEKQEKEKKGV